MLIVSFLFLLSFLFTVSFQLLRFRIYPQFPFPLCCRFCCSFPACLSTFLSNTSKDSCVPSTRHRKTIECQARNIHTILAGPFPRHCFSILTIFCLGPCLRPPVTPGRGQQDSPFLRPFPPSSYLPSLPTSPLPFPSPFLFLPPISLSLPSSLPSHHSIHSFPPSHLPFSLPFLLLLTHPSRSFPPLQSFYHPFLPLFTLALYHIFQSSIPSLIPLSSPFFIFVFLALGNHRSISPLILLHHPSAHPPP